VIAIGFGQNMRELLFTSAIATGIYAVVAVLIVVGSRFVGSTLWVPAVTYVGPALYFIGVVAVNRSAFGNIRSTALRSAALLGACGALTAVSGLLVFVLTVNLHLRLGGQL
jgi:hypothetical protein